MTERDMKMEPEGISGHGVSPDAADIAAGEEFFFITPEKMLSEVPGENPSGRFLYYEPVYDRIKAARQQDEDLPQGVWEKDLKRADWPLVKKLCIQALENDTKDIQICLWLTESLFWLHGFDGLKDGLQLLLGLLEKFWDTMYPEIEGDDYDGRVGPFVWLNEKLSIAIRSGRVSDPSDPDKIAYDFNDWDGANRLEEEARKDKKILARAEQEGRVTRAAFLGSVMSTPGSFYETKFRNLNRSVALVKDINLLLSDRCGMEAPSLARFMENLDEVRLLFMKFANEKKAQEDPGEAYLEAGDGDMEEGFSYGSGAGIESVSLSIRSRAEAYRMLTQAADYLLVHEPHSPAPHLVKRAISWGNMSLAELLQELLGEGSDLKQIYKLLGMNLPDGK